MNQNYPIPTAVDTVCKFLDITPVDTDHNDNLDSLTNKISYGISSSSFAQKIEKLSIDYSPLKLNTMLNAVMNGQSSDTTLRSLYHIGIKNLDELLGHLTKDYCANSCNQGVYRCCSNPYTFNFKFNDPEILKLQETESGIYEDYSDAGFDIPGCKYIADKGCTLKISKTPLCLGYLCNSITDYLREIAPVNSESFIEEMHNLQRISDVTIEAVNTLNKAATSGRLVLDEKNSK